MLYQAIMVILMTVEGQLVRCTFGAGSGGIGGTILKNFNHCSMMLCFYTIMKEGKKLLLVAN